MLALRIYGPSCSELRITSKYQLKSAGTLIKWGVAVSQYFKFYPVKSGPGLTSMISSISPEVIPESTSALFPPPFTDATGLVYASIPNCSNTGSFWSGSNTSRGAELGLGLPSLAVVTLPCLTPVPGGHDLSFRFLCIWLPLTQ